MKIRGPSELNDALNAAIGWRKKEISSLGLMVQNVRREHEKAMLRRTGTVLLYAHWEGFFKFAAECYLNFVYRQFHSYQQLSLNFVALASRSALRAAWQANRIAPHLGIAEFMLHNQANQAKFPCTVDSEDNLSAHVLQNILDELGLPFDTHWSSKALLIDGSLLKNRNAIAHGEKTEIDEPTFEELHKLVVDLLDYAQTCVENAAVNQTYLRK